jgi:short-subunit dehydrogenase
MLVDIPQEKMREMWERLRPMSPGVFAEKVIDSVARNKPIIVVPSWWKVFWWTNRLFPSLGIALAKKSFHKRTKELGLAHDT